MELQQFLEENFQLKFLKWTEIITQESQAVKFDSMYILVKDATYCDLIFIDSKGRKRTIQNVSREALVLDFPLKDLTNLSEEDIENWKTTLGSLAATIEIGSVTTIEPDEDAEVINSGTQKDAIFDFKIPKGATGIAATLEVGTVTTVDPEEPATVVNVGDENNAIFNIAIPQGIPGEDFVARYNDSGETLATDINRRVDLTSGTDVNYRITNTWYDGSPMNSSKVDGVIYRELPGGLYERKAIEDDAIPKVDTINKLRNFNGYFEGQTILLLGYYSPGDKELLQYKFTVQNFDSLVDDGGSIIKSSKGAWIAQFGDSVSVAHYGAKGDLVNDDYLPISRCANNHNNIVYMKNHYQSQPLVLTKSITIDYNYSNIETTNNDGLIKVTAPQKISTTLKTAYTSFQDYVDVNSVTNISVGDIINIKSPELFDPTRDYYYKQIVVKVIKISGTKLFISETMPFNISDLSTTIDVYQPTTVNLKNIKSVKGRNTTTFAAYCINLEYLSDSMLSNMLSIDYYKVNINNNTCYNLICEATNTGRSKNPSDTYDGYGICGLSFNKMTIRNCQINSGQHGVTTGGRGVCYGLVIENSVIRSEIWQLGLGMHTNSYSADIINSTLFGFLLAGNCKLKNVRFGKDSSLALQVRSLICYSVSNDYSNYYFENCDFKELERIEVNDNEQINSPTANKIGDIIFKNCKNIYLYSNVIATRPDKTLVIRNIVFDNVDALSLLVSDKITNIDVKNISELKAFQSSAGVINMATGNVDYLNVNNIGINPETLNYTIAFRTKNLKKAIFNNVKNLNPTSVTTITALLDINNASTIADVFFKNVESTFSGRNIQSSTLSGLRLFLVDSFLKFETINRYITLLTGILKIESFNTDFQITGSTVNSGIRNLTTEGSNKYYSEIDAKGIMSKYLYTQLSASTLSWTLQDKKATTATDGLVKQSTAVTDVTATNSTQVSIADSISISIADLATMTTADAVITSLSDAGATYDANAQNLINDLKSKYNIMVAFVNELKAKVNLNVVLTNDEKSKINSNVTLVNDIKSKYNVASTLSNSNKTQLNAKLAADRTSGQQA